MARNIYFSDAVRSEQRLYENIIIESLKMYGQDLYYLPRTIVNENRVLGEDVPSKFNQSYKIEMYIENTEGFDGEGDLFTKFGVEIRDEATFIVSRRRWNHTVGQATNEINGERPREGDIITFLFQTLCLKLCTLSTNLHSISSQTFQHLRCGVSCSNIVVKILIQTSR